MTRCDEIEPLLGELALGVLADDRRSAVLDHVGVCLGCRALLLELAATADALLQACPPAEPSPGFDTAVLAGIGASRRRRRSPRSIVAALVAAALLMAGGLVIGVRLGHHQEELRTAPLVASPSRMAKSYGARRCTRTGLQGSRSVWTESGSRPAARTGR